MIRQRVEYIDTDTLCKEWNEFINSSHVITVTRRAHIKHLKADGGGAGGGDFSKYRYKQCNTVFVSSLAYNKFLKSVQYVCNNPVFRRHIYCVVMALVSYVFYTSLFQ
jgi:hypothetical protein